MAVDQLTISDEQLLDKLGSARERLLREIRKAIIGQDEVVEQVLLALFVGGHSIITGVPGWQRHCSYGPSPTFSIFRSSGFSSLPI